jgi:group I intron endonuclease
MQGFQVYRLTNRVTDMSYIGVTGQSLKARCAGHRHMAEKGLKYPIAVAIRANGWESFDAETLIRCASKEDAYQREVEMINLFNTQIPHGYNQTPGGPGLLGHEVSEETRAKLRKLGLGRGKGIPLSPEHCAKLKASAARMVRGYWFDDWRVSLSTQARARRLLRTVADQDARRRGPLERWPSARCHRARENVSGPPH